MAGGSLAAYAARRIASGLVVLAVTSALVFALVSWSGDPLAQLRAEPGISDETLRLIVREKHLDKPLLVRYVFWVRDLVGGGLGTSLVSGRPIWPEMRRALGNTLQLVVAAEAVGLSAAFGVGVWSALRYRSRIDHALTSLSLIGFSTPVFWLALVLQVLVTNLYLETGFRLFYTAHLSSPSPANAVVDRLQHLALPVLLLAFVRMPRLSRYLRASIVEEAGSDYLRTARAKGLDARSAIVRHALPNALVPAVTVAALDAGHLLGGAVVIETVFAIDGMGRYLVGALAGRDVYPVMAWLMVSSTAILAFNLLADLVYTRLDPRIRHG